MIVFWGCYLSWCTRNVAVGYNESKEIAVSIYNVFLIGVVVIPTRFSLDLRYDVNFVVEFGEYS